MVGQMLSHYKLVEKLGAGSMGEVYLAEDLRLGRKVALKLLPPDLMRDEAAKARLIHEAQAASLLDHPNICTVYDIEELPTGQLLLAMAYCEGESLKTRLARGPLAVEETVELGCQMAGALAEAHAQGIVHRDIKPANAMVTRVGRVKLVDFGLAHLPEATVLTAPGTTLGTPAYMAPEQVRGEAADARADLWALGAVLYEMLGGRPPFGGETMQAVLYGVVHQAPEPLDRVRAGLPPTLVRIVNRALTKDRLARYQHAEQMLAELRACRARLSAAGAEAADAGVSRAPSIAVLPFANLSGDKENEYFSDGLAEDIIDALTQVPGLRVMARTSAFAFRGKEVDIREIGSQLNVEHILEGSVRRAGSRLRVTAQLVKASDGYHLWSQRFDREMTDVFAIQDEISQAIVERLAARLAGEAPGRLVRPRTDNLEAYDLYLRGLYYWNQRGEGLSTGLACFLRAAERDPQYALAHAGVANSYNLLGWYSLQAPGQAFPLAMDAANRALKIDESLAEGHTSLAFAKAFFEWDWQGAEREFLRAIELNPGYPTAHHWYAEYLTATGRADDALRETRRAHDLDPLGLIIYALMGLASYYSRRYDQAIRDCERTIEMGPTSVVAHLYLGLAYLQMGKLEPAVQVLERGAQIPTGRPLVLGFLGHARAVAGRVSEAKGDLAAMSDASAEEYHPFGVALVHLGLGGQDEALEWLERACEQHDPMLTWLKVDPLLDGLRSKSRFQRLLARLGLA